MRTESQAAGGERQEAGSRNQAAIARLAMALVLALAAALRLYGLSWDGGQWLHPDERQVYFVANRLGWPDSLAQALSPTSPLNPAFFAYGSLPFYLVRLLAALLAPLWPAVRDPGNLHLVGRGLSALLDLGTVTLTYRLARRLLQSPAPPASAGAASTAAPASLADGRLAGEGCEWRGVLAAALLGFAVLPIQSAHFYTADILLTFLVVLTLNLGADVVLGAGRARSAALAVVLGLALATKLSAALLLLPFFASHLLRPGGRRVAIGRVAGGLLLAAATFFVVQPYVLIDWRTFQADVLQESQIAWGLLDVPYTRQYAGTLPYLYSVWQLALWGLGLPLGAAAWAGLIGTGVRWLRRGGWAEALLLAWAGPYLAVIGLLRAKPLRYLLPLVPVLCICAASMLVRGYGAGIREQGTRGRRVVAWGAWGVVLLTLGYALAYVSLYAEPHSWLSASAAIYQHVPAGSVLAVEEWDTPLPLPLEVGGRARRIEEYQVRVLGLYGEPDDAAKWSALATDLAESDYVVIASRRLYGSIYPQPNRYPLASRYYQALFSGDLGFELVQVFARGPAWLNPLVPPWPTAGPRPFRPDESFVVYDHPRVLVFRNAGRMSQAELLRRVTGP